MVEYTIVYDKKSIKTDKILGPLEGKKQVSVVIPTFNEEGNIGRLVDAVSKALKDYSFEIVVVDDNSKDRTEEILIERVKKNKNLVAVFRKGARGVFSAQVVDGVKLSRGEIIVFIDADFSHPPEKIPELLKWTDRYDFVSASRYIPGGGLVGLPWRHKISTIVFNKTMKLFMGINRTDFTGVFHAIRKDKLMKIIPRRDAKAGEFDIDLLYNAKKRRYTFKEIPFVYVYRTEGTSKSKSMTKLAFIYGLRAVRVRLGLK